MEEKQYKTELCFFGQIFPMSINWQLLCMILNWKYKTGIVCVGYAKTFSKI